MRAIKFRGRYVFEANALYPAQNKWVCGFLYIEDGKCWIKDGRRTYCVIKESVGQYTGLKDKKGVEIYEGDIVRLHDYGKNDPRKIARIEWIKVDACFAVQNDDFQIFTIGKSCPFEIIGTLYENPELLENKK